MSVAYVHPRTFAPLSKLGATLQDGQGASFPIIGGIPRFCELDNYTSSFGRQWNLFEKTQMDDQGTTLGPSAKRLFAETSWCPESLEGVDILEVGSGAGRFSRAILQHSRANLYSVDYSLAVEANWRNNAHFGGARFHLAQASVYDLPFPDGRFDKVLCLGVLQHTPDFEESVAALISKTIPGGEIVVDFYPIRGWWTKVHAKYLLRHVTKRMDQEELLKLIDRNVDWLIGAYRFLERTKLTPLTRFLPLVDLRTLPSDLSERLLREWAVLDTFDMFSPAHDHPQAIASVARMFERNGAEVTFANFVPNGSGVAAVVRARKK